MQQNLIRLGDLRSSEELISDLYLDVRKKVNKWAGITSQTAQARMGYVGQHLTSVVTGFQGGKSGARGHDLLLPNDEYAEIKTCYRVDQLGRCNDCDARIASIEPMCLMCESTNIKRNDDSKWLIGIRHEEEFAQILEPMAYYLVLFDFVDLQLPDQIRSSIWEVDPKVPGFAYCMVDYRLNIQAKSTSKASFNLWPFELKFGLMRPKLIYRSIISTVNNSISTEVFPGRDEARLYSLRPLDTYSQSQNLKVGKVDLLAKLFDIAVELPKRTKRDRLKFIQQHIASNGIPPELVADTVATALFLDDIKASIKTLPDPLRAKITGFSSS